MQLRGRTVLITGASSGIGEATARALAQKGAKLLLLARSQDKLKHIAESLSAQGADVSVYPVDVSDAQAVARVAAVIRAKTGTPDVLINNAGAGRWLSLIETSAEEARKLTEAPYLAAVYVTREFLPGMLQRGSGHVVNLTSPASFVAWPNACVYIAARHALRGFTEALRSELHGTRIGVTLAVLGKVASPYWVNNPGSEERIPKLTAWIARTLSTDEAAAAIINGIERNLRRVVSPAVFKLLLHPLFTDWAIGLMTRYPRSR